MSTNDTSTNGNGNGKKLRTTVAERILALLADGQPHTNKEVHGCLYDELGPVRNVRAHITNLRKILRPKGEDIVCEFYKMRYCYRHIRLLASACDGRR